jgi:hypothetical protein
LAETHKPGILPKVKTILEIPDDLYRQAKIHAKMKDLVSEGLRLVLGLLKKTLPRQLRRMTKAPRTIRRGKVIPTLSSDEMATLLERSGERLPRNSSQM